MLGKLSKPQMDDVLKSQAVGRIGCYADGKLYVVPVAYAYHGQYIYSHSKEGMKIKMLRKNPDVCFEVDVVENLANWRSVIVSGTYEEMKGTADHAKGMKILMDRFTLLMANETIKPTHHSMRPQMVEIEVKAIVYRIKIVECTGRYEKFSDG